MPNEENTGAGVTLEAVLVPENLNAAWSSVKANDGAGGVDGRNIAQTQAHLREHWEAVAKKLRAWEYEPGAVRAKEIPKPQGGVRMLGIPNVQDRLIQQAIQQKLSEVFEPEFSENSYGFRPGRSTHDAVRKATGFVAEGKEWVADIDLKSFFDQVNHDILLALVARKVRCKGLLRLIGGYLRAPMQQPDGSKQARKCGTPQGGPLSPLLANIYLTPLDRELEKRGVAFVRYADDIAIFAGSERAAERTLESIVKWLKKHLKLEVNPDKTGVGRSDDGSLLGFRLYADGRVGVAPKAIERMKERVRKHWTGRGHVPANEHRNGWQEYIRGWWGYFGRANWQREVTDLSGWIRRHIRKWFWQRWHHPVGRMKALRKLGVKGRGIRVGLCSKGAWSMANHVAIKQALKNAVLRRWGLNHPWDDAKAAIS